MKVGQRQLRRRNAEEAPGQAKKECSRILSAARFIGRKARSFAAAVPLTATLMLGACAEAEPLEPSTGCWRINDSTQIFTAEPREMPASMNELEAVMGLEVVSPLFIDFVQVYHRIF